MKKGTFCAIIRMNNYQYFNVEKILKKVTKNPVIKPENSFLWVLSSKTDSNHHERVRFAKRQTTKEKIITRQMNDAKFDYGMTAMSALMKGAQAEKKLPSSEKKLTASPVPEGKQYLKDQKEQIEKDILHIKDDNFTEENEELIYSEGAAAEESEAQARESAEEIAEAQEEEKRNKRNRRKSVIKLVVIAISITIVIIIGSMQATTIQMTV